MHYLDPANEDNYPSNRYIRWVNGKAVPYDRKPLHKDAAQSIYNSWAALPYEGAWDADIQQKVINPEYVGMLNLEVLIVEQFKRAQAGDQKAISEIMDRILGKPKQSVESTNMNLSYTDFLMRSAQEEIAKGSDYYPQQYDTTFDGI